jgi:hypothetical protein
MDNRVFHRANFMALVETMQSQSKHLMVTKGKEYSGDSDALANFRRNGAALGLMNETVLLTYAGKHWDSIQSYVKVRQQGANVQLSEPIVGRALDLINYMYLFIAMCVEDAEGQIGAAVGTSNWQVDQAAPLGSYQAMSYDEPKKHFHKQAQDAREASLSPPSTHGRF